MKNRFFAFVRRGSLGASLCLSAILFTLVSPAAGQTGKRFAPAPSVVPSAPVKARAARQSSPFGSIINCAPAPVGLVNFYGADGKTDDARSRNNATLHNGADYLGSRVGQAFAFDGADDYAVIERQVSDDFTISFWMRTTQTGGLDNDSWYAGYGLIDAEQPGETGDFGIALGNGKVLFGTGAPDTTIKSVDAINDGGWRFVVATRDRNAGELKLYINGAIVASGSAGTSALDAAATLNLGRISTGVNYFDGQLDEIGIYDRVLSAGEIETLYQEGTGSVCQPLATAAPAGLLAWYGGEGSSSDLSGNGHSATPVNGGDFVVGKVGQSFSFDGVDDRVEIPNVINGRSQMTVEAWFNYTEAGAYRWIYATGPGFVEIGAAVSPIDQTLRYHFATDEDSFVNGDGSHALSPNTWYHFAMTYDGSQVQGYIDGQLDFQRAIFGSVNAPSTTAIGAGFWDIDGEVFKGSIDELSVYDRALSQNEVQSVVDAGLAGKLKLREFAEVNQATVGTATFHFSPTNFMQSIGQEIPLDIASLPPVPAGFEALMAFDESLQSDFAGATEICFNVPALAGNFASLKVLHLENGAWVNRTAPSNSSPVLCTSGLGSFSPFMIVNQIAPTAARVSIGGRVKTAAGAGIRGALVTLHQADGSVLRATTNNFGYYRIADVNAGQTATLSVTAGKYRFAQPSQVVSVSENVSGVDFTAGQ